MTARARGTPGSTDQCAHRSRERVAQVRHVIGIVTQRVGALQERFREREVLVLRASLELDSGRT